LKVTIRMRPHARLVLIAVLSGKIKIGTRNVRATISLERNVAMVASQTCLWLFFEEDSCEMWMLSASENASAIAIVRTPPIMAVLRAVAAFRPTMMARVVMTPEVRPNASPIFREDFIDWGRG